MSSLGPQSVTTANVASSATNVTVFSASPNARGRAVFNDSTALLYLKFGATATTTSFTVQIPAGSFYEFPRPTYSGQVDGIWAAANGAARTTQW